MSGVYSLLSIKPLAALTFKKTGDFSERSVARAIVLPPPSTITGAIIANLVIKHVPANKKSHVVNGFDIRDRNVVINEWHRVHAKLLESIFGNGYELYGPFIVAKKSEIEMEFWRVFDVAVNYDFLTTMFSRFLDEVKPLLKDTSHSNNSSVHDIQMRKFREIAYMYSKGGHDAEIAMEMLHSMYKTDQPLFFGISSSRPGIRLEKRTVKKGILFSRDYVEYYTQHSKIPGEIAMIVKCSDPRAIPRKILPLGGENRTALFRTMKYQTDKLCAHKKKYALLVSPLLVEEPLESFSVEEILGGTHELEPLFINYTTLSTGRVSSERNYLHGLLKKFYIYLNPGAVFMIKDNSDVRSKIGKIREQDRAFKRLGYGTVLFI